MIVDLNINIATIASIIVSAIAVLGYSRTVKQGVETTRMNDLKHIDIKLDVMSKRIDDIYKLLAERSK